jgi:hypothetical protein
MTADNNANDFNSLPGEATSVIQREVWCAPTSTVLLVADAELGAFSNPDADSTAS